MKKNYIKRERYLAKLISRMNNGEVKIITGVRRCGKSWLLQRIFRDYLIDNKIDDDHIIIVSLDQDDELYGDLTIRDRLKDYIYSRINSSQENFYVILDEIQEVDGFERLVNGLMAHDNIDVYLTGSNSHLLSSDIRTIFRGRGDEIRVYPLSFNEFCTGRDESITELWKEYYTYGGMPGLLVQRTPEQKFQYLQRLWNKTYMDDVVERNKIRQRDTLASLTEVLCSAVGSLTNPNRLCNVLNSKNKSKIDSATISRYIEQLEDAFLFEGASRYDIKGNKYFERIKKYYSVDIGLRNARLNFRQQDMGHIMENVIFNELRMLGFAVDVGVVPSRESNGGKSSYVQYEVDFIANNGMQKYYIQSALQMDNDEKMQQELKSLRRIDDSFTKIVIVANDIATFIDESGIIHMGLFQFLNHGLRF